MEAKSRTTCLNNRGATNYSVLHNGVNGHMHDANNDLHNGFGVSMDVKDNGQQGSSFRVIDREDNSELGVLNQVNNHNVCQQSSLKPNVFSACQGVVTSDNMCHNVLLYDVSVATCDENVEVSNVMLL